MIRSELFCRTRTSRAKTMLLVVTVAGSMLISPGFSQSPAPVPVPGKSATPVPPPPGTASALAAKTAAAGTATRYQPDRFAGRAGRYYPLTWGIDSLSIRAVESGELIRFSYRVVNADKASSLHDKKIDPMLIFPDGNVKLVIPSLEKVGQLRQTGAPEAGRSYWMAFSNPRMTVKRGDHVNVVIGQFHADGLVVE
jgi:hypothetical protein